MSHAVDEWLVLILGSLLKTKVDLATVLPRIGCQNFLIALKPYVSLLSNRGLSWLHACYFYNFIGTLPWLSYHLRCIIVRKHDIGGFRSSKPVCKTIIRLSDCPWSFGVSQVCLLSMVAGGSWIARLCENHIVMTQVSIIERTYLWWGAWQLIVDHLLLDFWLARLGRVCSFALVGELNWTVY